MATVRHHARMAPSYDLGSIPDWVEAVGTSGALIYIAVQHHRDRQKDREVAKVTEATKRDNEARQARLASVTSTWRFDPEGEPQADRSPGWRATMTVMNDSSEPIRSIEPGLRDRGTGESGVAEWWWVGKFPAVLRPGEHVDLVASPQFQPDEPADDSCYGPGDPHPRTQLGSRYQEGVYFTDAAGLRWFQSTGGLPVRQMQS